MDASQQPQQPEMQDSGTRQCQTQQPSILEHRPSPAQENMAPIIGNIFNEAKSKRECGTDPTWENMVALGKALEIVDVDAFNARTNHEQEALESTRPAKLQMIEMLYEHARRMSKRELASFIYYVLQMMGEMEEWLLEGNMGEGYWNEEWLNYERLLLALGPYSGSEEDDEPADDGYRGSDEERGLGRGDGMDENMKE